MAKQLHPNSTSCHTHELPLGNRFATSLPRRQILLHSLGAAFTLLANRPADALGQSPNLKTSPNPTMLRRSSFLWTQAEREYGFAHWDQVFSGRIVETNPVPHPLPTGLAIDQLLDAQPDASDSIENFIAQNKVAGLIIIHKGTIRSEHYALGHSKTGRWTSQSIAKSITSTLVGAAIQDRFIAGLDDPVIKYIPDLIGSAYQDVTIKHLMNMTSGIEWNENYADPASDISRFYTAPITPGLNATVSYMRHLKRAAKPGARWLYNTGDSHLLGVVVSSATRQTLAEYLSAKIWKPCSMNQPAVWATDRTHHELAGCCLSASLRDFARFGQFVIESGQIQGRQVVPQGWFQAASKNQIKIDDPHYGYGYQWWIRNQGSLDALGIHGQFIHADPSRSLVVVIQSAWPEPTSVQRSSDQQKLLRRIVKQIDMEMLR